MIDRVKTRLGSEQGFTLIELLVVIIILGILVAIAVPSYLSFRGKATTAAEKSNVRSAIPAAESYYQETSVVNGTTTYKSTANTYSGLVGAALRFEAPGVSNNVNAVDVNSGAGYCIEDSEDSGTTTYDYVGGDPGTALQSGYAAATIQSGTCQAAVGTAAS